MSKLYKVKLVQGFNAGGRSRAGIRLEKGVTQTLELTKEQLEALEADVHIDVSEADKGAKPTSEGGEGGSEVTDPYEGVSFKDLKAQATEKGLDIKGLKSRADVIAVLEAKPAEEEEDDDEEEVDLSTKTLEELEAIADELELDRTEVSTEADLIKLIEDSQTEDQE